MLEVGLEDLGMGAIRWGEGLYDGRLRSDSLYLPCDETSRLKDVAFALVVAMFTGYSRMIAARVAW